VSAVLFAQQEVKRLAADSSSSDGTTVDGVSVSIVDELEPKHLLLGVLSAPEGAYRSLQRCKVYLPEVAEAVEKQTAALAIAKAREAELARLNNSQDSNAQSEGNNLFGGMFNNNGKKGPGGSGGGGGGGGDIPFSASTQKVFPRALELSQKFDSEIVRSEHLLLALLLEGGYEVSSSADNGDLAVALSGVAETLLAVGVDGSSLLTELVTDVESGTGKAELVAGGGGGLSDKKLPALSECCTDLTALAREGKLDPVAGRTEEVARALQVLVRRRKSNPCLIGDPGVGKTAIAEGIAQRIVSGDAPKRLLDCRVLSLDLASLVAGTKYRGDFEERLKAVVNEVVKESEDPKSAGRIVLFIDEIHTLVGAGAAEGGIDAANVLKPALARGEMQVIGATTVTEYRQHIEKDAALERRFQPILIGEPSVVETVEILRKVKPSYEEFHGVQYTEEALEAAAKLSWRYINDRFLPDKAIDLMDEAGALLQYRESMDAHGGGANGEDDVEAKKKEEEEEEEASSEGAAETPQLVTAEVVAEVVGKWTGIPVSKLSVDDQNTLLNLHAKLSQRVIGQKAASKAVARAVRRARVGLCSPQRPVASFVFCGPTGVGKTELCKALASEYYGSEKTGMVRLDMSEYMDRHTVSRLTGPPPGYIGYEQGGQLTEAVRRQPHSVVLLDEIEKAHPDVFNVMLQILDDGRLTDSKGRTVDFSNTIFILTSNIGSKAILEMQQKEDSRLLSGGGDDDDDDDAVPTTQPIKKKKKSGSQSSASSPSSKQMISDVVAAASSTEQEQDFSELADYGNEGDEEEAESETEAAEYVSMQRLVKKELLGHFRPEFLNRLDEIIVFKSLKRRDLGSVCQLMLDQVVERAKEAQGLKLEVDQSLVDRLCVEGASSSFGARPLRRAVQRLVDDVLAQCVLDGFLKQGDVATLTDDHSNDRHSLGSSSPGVAVVRAARSGGTGEEEGNEEVAVEETRRWVAVTANAGIEDDNSAEAAPAGGGGRGGEDLADTQMQLEQQLQASQLPQAQR